MTGNDTLADEAFAVMRAMWDSYGRKALAATLSHFATGDLYILGSGEDELILDSASLAKGLSQEFTHCDGLRAELWEEHVSGHGEVVWFGAKCRMVSIIEGQEMALSGRLTAVLLRQEGTLRIVQSHFSLPHVDLDEEGYHPDIPGGEVAAV